MRIAEPIYKGGFVVNKVDYYTKGTDININGTKYTISGIYPKSINILSPKHKTSTIDKSVFLSLMYGDMPVTIEELPSSCILYDDRGKSFAYTANECKYNKIVLYGKKYRMYNMEIWTDIIDGKPKKYFHMAINDDNNNDFDIVRNIKLVENNRSSDFYNTYDILDLNGVFLK